MLLYFHSAPGVKSSGSVWANLTSSSSRVVAPVIELAVVVIGNAGRVREQMPHRNARHEAGAGKNFVSGSLSATLPSSTCSMTAAAVNCLPSEPD